jgi:hypothetical protein
MKVLRLLAVLILSLEFLPPAFANDLSSSEASPRTLINHLPSDSQKNPFILLAEETDTEEGNKANPVHKTILPVVERVVVVHGGWINRFDEASALRTGNFFDTHPALFRLHCLLLL